MKNRGILPILLIIVFCGIAICTISNSCKTSAAKNNKPVSANNAAFEDFNFSEYSDNGASKKFTIQGKRLGLGAGRIGVFRVSAIEVTEISDAFLTIYENGEPVSRIMAKKAILSASPLGKASLASIVTRIEFSGKVDVVTSDKKTLVCRNATWDKARNRLYARGDCILRSSGGLVRADYIDSDLKLCEFSSRNDKLKRLRALGRAII